MSLSRVLTDRFGERGHNNLNNGFGIVAGWGKTQTSADSEISIVSTANQQKVQLPIVSLNECIEKYLELGINLSKDLRQTSRIKSILGSAH